MSGTVLPAVGQVCPVCSSTVERILHAASGHKDYNRLRLHSALQYFSPEQYEKQIERGTGEIQSRFGATVEFPRPRNATGRHDLQRAKRR
jgi:hypothetical protein